MRNKLFDVPELIVIKVIVSFVVIVQVLLTPPIVHDVAPFQDTAFIKFSHV